MYMACLPQILVQECLHAVITGVSSHPQHVCVCGDNTTPRRIDGVAQLGPL